MTAPSRDAGEAEIVGRLSTLDRFLPVWIILAMVAGLLLGRLMPGLQGTLDAVKIDNTSLLIAIGLFAMMYPVLARVKYEEIGHLAGDRRMLWLSLVLNWLIGPLLMFALAWIFLADHPTFRTGLIVIGLARCIAMVLIWNDLACGDREAGALLVAVNSVFQIAAYALLGTFYLAILPGWLGLGAQDVAFSTWDITKAVLIFLGIPLALGYVTRRVGVARKGRAWYDEKFAPRIAPIALYGLLFTIVVMFALQGDAITSDPGSVALIAVPLLIYFAVMWFSAIASSHALGLPYARSATVAFTAAGNNFELAIAVSIGVWGVTSGQALTGVIGPLVEVPALVALVYVSLWLRRRWRWTPAPTPTGDPMTDKPSVLFVCVHNAGRSQMAAAFVTALSGGAVEVRSAGSAPADSVNPAVVAAMLEEGIDIAAEVPKVLTVEAVRASDVVITMGCGDACPVFPGKRYLDWALDDPAGQGVDAVRPIRDDIKARVLLLLRELDAPLGAAT